MRPTDVQYSGEISDVATYVADFDQMWIVRRTIKDRFKILVRLAGAPDPGWLWIVVFDSPGVADGVTMSDRVRRAVAALAPLTSAPNSLKGYQSTAADQSWSATLTGRKFDP